MKYLIYEDCAYEGDSIIMVCDTEDQAKRMVGNYAKFKKYYEIKPVYDYTDNIHLICKYVKTDKEQFYVNYLNYDNRSSAGLHYYRNYKEITLEIKVTLKEMESDGFEEKYKNICSKLYTLLENGASVNDVSEIDIYKL